jgi:hypothetical protein
MDGPCRYYRRRTFRLATGDVQQDVVGGVHRRAVVALIKNIIPGAIGGIGMDLEGVKIYSFLTSPLSFCDRDIILIIETF